MYCNGDMKRGTTTYHVDKDDIHIILDKMPAWVCDQCHEVYFEESDVDSIQAFSHVVSQQADKLQHSF